MTPSERAEAAKTIFQEALNGTLTDEVADTIMRTSPEINLKDLQMIKEETYKLVLDHLFGK